MLAMFKFCAVLALASFAAALDITTISGNVVSEGSITITWTTATTDPAGTFSIELDHPSFNSALAIATNVDSSDLTITIPLPNVPAQSGYTLEFVDISDINTIFATSSSFSIGAVSSTQSTTLQVTDSATTTSASATNSASGSASGSGSASAAPSGTPLSTKAAPTTNTGFGTTASNTAPATSATSSPSPSATGSSGALSLRVPGALLAVLGLVAGAVAL